MISSVYQLQFQTTLVSSSSRDSPSLAFKIREIVSIKCVKVKLESSVGDRAIWLIGLPILTKVTHYCQFRSFQRENTRYALGTDRASRYESITVVRQSPSTLWGQLIWWALVHPFQRSREIRCRSSTERNRTTEMRVRSCNWLRDRR